MKLLLLYLFSFAFSVVMAQESGISRQNGKLDKKNKYYAIGFGIESAHYFGDLHEFSTANLFKTSRLRPGVSIHGLRTLSSNLEMGVALSWQRLFADDFQYANPDRQQDLFAYTRNLHFRNDLLGVQVFWKYKFFKNTYTFLERRIVNPFIISGINLYYSNPKARLPEFNVNNERFLEGDKWTALRPLGTEGQFNDDIGVSPYSPVQLAIPLGLGVNVKVHNKIDVSLSLKFNYFFSDYLDDVSSEYVDLGALKGEKAKVLSDRSREINGAIVNQPREMDQIDGYTDKYTYFSEFDGQAYTVWEGYGASGMQRGDGKSRDFVINGSFKITYILSPDKKKSIF